MLGFAATAQAERFIGVVNPFLHRCDGTQHNADCLSNKDLKRMSRAHLKIVRWGFRWAVAQPGPGPYRWSSLD